MLTVSFCAGRIQDFLRASFNFPAAENWEEIEALHKSRQFISEKERALLAG